MKKLMLLVIFMFVAGIALAHGSGWRSDNRGSGNNWKDMDQHHNLMHDSQVKAEKIDKGIKIEMTAESKDIQGLIQKEFLEKQDDLKSYFDDVEIIVRKLDNGIELTLSANDSRTVEQLQYYGNGLVYRYLRDKIHNSRTGRGGYRGHHGRSGGWGCDGGSDGAKWDKGPMSFYPGMLNGMTDSQMSTNVNLI